MAVAVKTVGQEFVILISILLTLCSAQSGVRGPPQAEQKELKKVGRIGENIKLICPIVGYPTPMVEWSKNGDPIDYMWERHRIGKKALKIKHATEDDTGIYTCKGINGFGSEEVRVELIVVDPRILPKGLDDSLTDVAPPVFTQETKISKKSFTKSIGDTFKVSCEALGSPQPEIFWFKDGQHIDSSVHYQRGRSTVELNIMGTADSGVYSCRARNLLGEQSLNFTLDVEVGTPHAIVTEAGPSNTTVMIGEDATLQCKVKSIDQPPHIKWLKRLEPYEPSTENTLKVATERYKILNTNTWSIVGSIGNDEYLNKFVIEKATIEDTGLYICFVTNSGFGPLTYRAMNLKVEERRPNIEINVNNDSQNNSGEPPSLLIIVIVLAVLVLTTLSIIACCVCLKKDQNKDTLETQSSTGACSDVERPFMPQTNPQLMKNNNRMLNKPLPPTPMTLAQWSSAIHPQTSPKYSADSGFNDHDNSKELNQYEVPYAHLLRHTYRPSEDIYFTQEAFMQPQNSVVSGYFPPQRQCTQPRFYEYETQ